MKTRLLVISIFVLLFGSSLCMAKTTVLITPMVHVGTADTVQRNTINGGDAFVNLTVELRDMDGTVINSDTFGLFGQHGEYAPLNSLPDSTYFCRFIFTGKNKSLRGLIVVSNTSTGVIHAAIPAN